MQYITGRIGKSQNVAYTASAGIVAAGVSTGVNKVRVLVTTDAFVSTDGGANSAYVPALKPEYFTVTQGQKVSATQVAAGGTLYINEIE
ncbi:hypothetical protein AOQ73_05840 [Bradyrhizobium pachyrhizi]|uniref:hypothetical protein n=1 Tax=Bradyrhizobium pachyrhizi TaxID=280333 RepID=UPI000704EC2B|nr:hypothetical protein [Bradyrhizobium pachyrhizi]KRQ11928.1 hypothetical protein AOQ73_05840 [Bradyrhizobium pachyrhizi]